VGSGRPNEKAISKIDWPRFRKKRIRKLISVMKREGVDALLLNRIENVRYATDFRPVVSVWFQNSYAAFVTSKGDAVQLTVAGDYIRAKHYMPWVEDMRIMHAMGREKELGKLFDDYVRGGKIGYDSLSFEERSGLESEIGSAELAGVGSKIAEERAVKLDDELVIMREASKATQASIRAALGCAAPGMREYEVAAEAEYAARRLGAEGMSWGLATFSGLNTGLMLRHDSDKDIKMGEFLILGYATIYRAYNTDITTTTIIGKPNSEQKRLYTATYDAFRSALRAVRPGVQTRDIHNAADKVIQEFGYGKYSFRHLQPILHGVGLNVYEPPWSPEPGRDKPTMRLRVGHTLAIEPCINLYDRLDVGGCRIGESLAVTENGYELLTDGKPETHEVLYEN
jgi:Xaa-Pro aminopeptidase